MQIISGTRIGGYEVVEPLGAGGMGNVYRAADRRLGRDVAIKTLPPDLAQDPAALARFEREARFLASLNHPNIAAIYGIEEFDGERFLILELVPGTTLEGPIPVDEAIRIAIDIASALEAAHQAGIIHRDLKPSNVKITPDGRVKTLDFGIAKQVPGAAKDLTGQVTVESDLTRDGSIVGTPAYMSPEQIRGGEIDRRADIWAFGCVLYEMLTGKRAFGGRAFMEVADAVQHNDPDWSALPGNTPQQVRHVLSRCLNKDPRERLHDIADARLELQEIAADRRMPSGTGKRNAGSMVIVLAAIAVIAVAIVGWRLMRTRATHPATSPTALKLTQFTVAAGLEEFPSWSPDGNSIVYAGDVHGVRKLFLKRVNGQESQLTTGEYDDLEPAWSPDGRRILFVRAREPNRRMEPGDVFGIYEPKSGDIWSIDLKSRRESRLVEDAYGPAFSPDGASIAVDASWAGPRRIWIVDSRGHNPQQVSSDTSEAVSHILPTWSPDSKKIAYQRQERTTFDIRATNTATRETFAVTPPTYKAINPAWSPRGNFVYFSSDRGGGMNVWRLPVGADGKPAGPSQQLTTGAGQDIEISISKDGKRLAYATLRQNADLWRMPITEEGKAGAPEALIATTREDSRGAWSPDGQTIAFNSDRAGDMNIWLYSLADHTARQITRGSGGDFQPNWSPDGRQIVFFSSRSGNADIWKADVASGSLTQLTRNSALDINPFFSPDGSEVAYQSDASGRLEVWVMRSDGSQPRQRTDVGVSGHFNRWLRDGFIYFRCPCGASQQMMRVSPAAGDPHPVVALAPGAGAHISFSPDASKFIDVVRHKVLWLYDLHGAATKLFEFPDSDVRIDYPVWSPDGRWLMFDRFKPEGGDVWIADGID